jgi:hypothetical protein
MSRTQLAIQLEGAAYGGAGISIEIPLLSRKNDQIALCDLLSNFFFLSRHDPVTKPRIV